MLNLYKSTTLDFKRGRQLGMSSRDTLESKGVEPRQGMKGFLSRGLPQLRRGQAGFTLVELLVVVGIIVALAAVIIPSVAAFASKGTTGSMAEERDNVQTAIDIYMADNGVVTVPANIIPMVSSTNDFSAATGVLDLSSYLRKDTTEYFYCWGGDGWVRAQDKVATANCTRLN